MANCSNRSCRSGEAERAQQKAQAIIAQGRQVARSVLEEQRGTFPAGNRGMEEEPMNRYIHPIRPPQEQCVCPAPCDGTETREYLSRILECMACQNQLLIDLLGAVNALTAATLSGQSR